MNLRPYQAKAVADILTFLRDAPKGASWLGSAPTGSGKSAIHAEVGRQSLADASTHLLVPTVEIAAGIVRAITGVKPAGPGFPGEKYGVYTYKRYYNLLSSGSIGGPIPYPKRLGYDEAHHAVSGGQLAGVWDMAGRPTRWGLTATPYRGTPAETQKFRREWGDPHEIISLRDAVAGGYISRPTFAVWPLIDDDLIQVVNGEFVVSKVTAAVKDKTADVVERVGAFYDPATGLYDRPTCLTFSAVEQVRYALRVFADKGLPAVGVTGDDDESIGMTADREAAFAEVIARRAVLLQIKVVGEGVDLPLRRLIDLAPTMSPLLWMQRIGRITRPVGGCERCGGLGYEVYNEELSSGECERCGTSGREPSPEYIACCHNITRHSYLWHGLIPADEVRKAQAAWGPGRKPTRRGLARALGLEGFGRFAPSHVPLADGLTATFYALQQKGGDKQFSVFLHPTDPTPLYFERTNGWLDGDDHLLTVRDGVEIRGRRRAYGKWRRIAAMPDVDGCVSLPPSPMTPGQEGFWASAAGRYGLDAGVVPDARTFQCLPVLADARLRVRQQG